MGAGNKGFTLIEVMIVVAIIGILSSIAVPQYMDFTTRAKISEGFVLFSSAKTQIAESYLAGGSMPVAAQGQNLMPDASISGYVKAFTYAKTDDSTATIDIVFFDLDGPGPMSEDDIIRFTGSGGAGTQVNWECIAGTTIAEQYLPTHCR